MLDTYALLDECSDVSLCTHGLVESLGVPGKEADFSLTTVNEKSSSRKGMEVSLSVESLDSSSCVEISKLWTVDDIPVSAENMPKGCDISQWSHLQGIEFPEVADKQVSLLIGADVPEAFWVLDQRRGGKRDPYAVKTPLGWTLIGPTRDQKSQHFHVNFTHCSESSVQEQLVQMWNAEFNDAPGGVSMSVEDKRALDIMTSSVVQTEDGHYELSMPWRQKPPDLQNNRSMAETRLAHLKRRLMRDPDLRQKYQVAMTDNIQKGYASKVPDQEVGSRDAVWYLPHHPVSNEHKPHKVRVVFDCAASYRGTSLNDQLLTGPDLTNSLVGVLTRFRQHPIALMADIEAMFNQVRASPSDRNYLRFLWWPDDFSQDPEEYRMNVHLFGATSSPSCANFCLKRVAEDHGSGFDRQVASSVDRNFYVDDFLKSVYQTNDAVQLVTELPALLSAGGFRLRGWNSNSNSKKIYSV